MIISIITNIIVVAATGNVVFKKKED